MGSANPGKEVCSTGSPTWALISQVLRWCKVPWYYTGFQALAAAVYLVLFDRTLLDDRTKKLYPLVAVALGKEWTTVETDIRYAVQKALEQMGPEEYQTIFATVPNQRPTAGNFIDAVAAAVLRCYGQ